MTDEDLLCGISPAPPAPPTTRLLWTAIFGVADRVDLGAAPGGYRFMVPILGGRFCAGPGIDGLAGRVLPDGADRQLVRPDGVKALDALYEMQADIGEVITVRNRVLVDEARKPDRYAMSVISARAPTGPLDWLNRRLLIGTLQTARPARQAVVVRAWEADCQGSRRRARSVPAFPFDPRSRQRAHRWETRERPLGARCRRLRNLAQFSCGTGL